MMTTSSLGTREFLLAKRDRGTWAAARKSLAAGVMLFTLIILVYWPAYSCRFIWDDDDYILENKALRTNQGLARIWCDPTATPQYYPLVHSTFWIEYQLWKVNPVGYHVVNVVLHALSAVTLWRILTILEVPGAWLAAAVFGIHPVHVESVAWITERKNVLSALCYLSSLRIVIPVLFGERKRGMSREDGIRYACATIFFIGALLSKSVTCSLPAACLLIVYWRHGSIERRDVVLMLPWFVMGCAAAMLTAWLEKTHVGARGSIFSWTLPERCWIAGHAVWFYLGKLLWPYPLTFFYPRWHVDTSNSLSWIGPIFAVLLPFGLWSMRHRIGRGPLVASLFYGGTLLPALGFINVYPMRYSFVADHFQYLASLGPISLFGAAWEFCMKRLNVGVRTLGMAAMLVCLSLLTWKQEEIYHDVESLWTAVLAHNPNSFAAHFHLGKVRVAQSRDPEAIEHFRESLRLQTDDSETGITLTLLGNSLSRQGHYDEAEDCYQRALRYDPRQRDALHGLATAAARQSRYTEAVEIYRRVLLIPPEDAKTRVNLGNALAALGKLDEAIVEYESALKVEPGSADASFNLANVFARQGRFDDAERLYLKVLQQRPDHKVAMANLTKVRAQRDKSRANP